MEKTLIEVEGFALDPARRYDPRSHMWIAPAGSDGFRVGFDPLGRETSGDVVSLSFAEVGTHVTRGEAFGDVEAAKLVGPLPSPLSGTLERHNAEALADPSRVNEDPLGTWLVEIRPSEPAELAEHVTGDGLADWFAAEVRRFREKGMIAE